jgi:membrane-bound serine protease (ClpP class)
LFRLSLKFIIPGVVLTAAFFILVVGQGLRAQRLPVKVGKELMIGKIVKALTPIDSAGGKIFLDGAYWNARCEVPVQAGEAVKISAVQGLTVIVQPSKP